MSQVAKTILDQLGGNRFAVMTGAKNFLGSPNALSFRLPGGGGFCKGGINSVRIVLDASDLYRVTFYKIRGTKVVTVADHDGIYCDQLAPVFSAATGLATHL